MSFQLTPVDPAADGPLLHSWVTAPRARFWQMQGASQADVVAAYAEIDASPHHDAFLGRVEGEPVFLTERYDPAADPVSQVFEVEPGDIGMHLLVGPTTVPVPGFTLAVMRTVLAWLFDDPVVHRVVVEPDAANTAVHRLNALAGFVVVGEVELPTKRALVSTCTREQFLASLRSSEMTA
ncbi:GNAT family N-acetyltransferase [Modestobacter sp. Leaf380]|uniref:GNAT family N-acetyltransferase n=1 Tax=Modestobacter sp. Leaf380 TaxID=1736356 RepID=UPI0006FEF8FD|nr:GNAT family N-acetyltransferase [Modestobacter sp. Leaf380]KQS68480.1 acetyltransferase [Modestobacter sp. Leaf380]